MALGAGRMVLVGESPYAHEQEAIRFVQEALPNVDPYHAWALFELPDPSTGRLLEVDLLVLGYGALYLVEVKSHPGRITGDATDWYWQPPEGGRRWIEPPYRLANLKAKVLKSRLRQHIHDDKHLPYVQALVFMSAPNLELDLRPDGRMGVVTRAELAQAITHHDFPGKPAWIPKRIDARRAREVAQALDKLGVRRRKGKVFAGSYALGELVDDTPAFQDREATRRENDRVRARARTYLVPQQTTVERRQQLRRAADREHQLLYDVREHPNVLQVRDYVPDAPLGPTVLFDAFEGGAPLSAFLRSEPSPTFEERMSILEQVARALAHCHRRAVFHGALSPEAVLVRRSARETKAGTQSEVEVRLHNFLLGQSQDVEGTSHFSALATDRWTLYMAPELREGAHARDALTDVWSLGALAYFLFTGQPPAKDLIELYDKLDRDRCLDVRIAGAVGRGGQGEIPEALAVAIDQATDIARVQRADDVEVWLELTLDELTRPGDDDGPSELDPLDARKGDILGDLLVDGPLGQGATSRVLHVRRGSDGRELALKVSLSPEHDERLAAEAAVLERLRSSRIVSLVDTRAVGGRRCLLLTLAGRTTLRRLLDQEGTVSLDLASRYGDDLLAALEHLEEDEVRVLHRDIKPANIGVGGTGKSALHLSLFDFSLSEVPLTELGVGTSAYRDPFLPARGAWDAAADRWSAAVTLHEMLTGVRPSYGGSALDPSAALTLAAERFDPSVREALRAFFERALHRDVERRFDSAKAMRHAWFRAFEAPAARAPESVRPSASTTAETTASAVTPSEGIAVAGAQEDAGDDAVRAIRPDTPIEALPLTARAKNALDRAGLTRAAELYDLPENRLTAVRGVGTTVAKEILDLRERWRSLAPLGAPEAAAPFFADFAGDDVAVDVAGLDDAASVALLDAGLPTLRALARAPKAQVEALLRRAGVAEGAVQSRLRALHAEASEGERRLGLEPLLAQLLPAKKTRAVQVRALYGLDAPFEGRLDVSAREVAEHTGKTTANLYTALGELREAWADHEGLDPIHALAEELLARAEGAEPLGLLARSLLAALPHDEAAPEPLRLARAAALVRIVAEVQKEDLDGLRVARLGRGELWVLASQAYSQALRRLGEAADTLAEREVFVTAGEAQRRFEAIARGTPLEVASPERLAEWAAAASQHAARSARLEIYPCGLSPERAIAHSVGLLKGALAPAQLEAKILARYPEAAPLPPRPALDALLAPHGLLWDEALGVYRRKTEAAASHLGTTLASRTRGPSVVSTHAKTADESAHDRADFDKKLQIALERRALRVLTVHATLAFDAIRALEARLDVKAEPLDAMLLRAMKTLMADLDVDPAVVHAADREGEDGPDWPNLVALATAAAAQVADTLRARREPLLLTQPGLIARYGLTGLLDSLVARSQEDDAPAIFLVLPQFDRGGAPTINGRLAIPGVLPGQAVRVPSAFVQAREDAGG